MRIALVAQNSPIAQHEDLDPNSTTARVTSLAQALADLGHRITIYARRDTKALPDSAILAPGVTVEHVTAGPPAPLDPEKLTSHLPEFGSYLAQRWSRSRPDVAHAHYWTSGLATLAAAQNLGVPVAQTFSSLGAAEQRYYPSQPPSETRVRLEACLARSADMVLASSAQEQADLARLGVPRSTVRVVPCGVDTERFSPDGTIAERSARPRLLAAESLTAPRGLGSAVRALAEIPEAELVIMGGPGQAELSKDKTYREIMRFAKQLGVADRLVCTGQITPDELPALLRSADLLISTAKYEPVGTSAIQAMACGTPVVASAVGAEQDAIVDLTTGLLVPPGRPSQLALRIRRLLASPLQLEAYGIAAVDRARSRYSWERIGRETVAAYDTRRTEPAAAARTAEPDAIPARAREARRVPAGARV